MNPRERILALIAMGAIFIVGSAVLGYQFYLRPVRNAETRRQQLEEDIAKDEQALADFVKSKPRLTLAKRLSLPKNEVKAQSEYSSELEKMLRNSNYSTDAVTVFPKPLEKRTNVPASKRLPYAVLKFDVSAKGDISNLVDFLDRFYRTPLLHRIKSMSITRPVIAGVLSLATQQRTDDLDVTMSIEALIVDGAEDRDTLLPKGVEMPKRLARSTTQYLSIAGRNMFFGPPPALGPTPLPKVEGEIGDFIVFTGITHNENGSFASLYDGSNKRTYEIQRKPTGKVEVNCFYYIKDKKTKWGATAKELNLLDDSLETFDSYNVVRIDAADMILEYEGDYYRMHIGTFLSDMKKPLTTSEAKALGLPVKDEKKEDKKDAKKEDAKEKKDVKISIPKPEVKLK